MGVGWEETLKLEISAQKRQMTRNNRKYMYIIIIFAKTISERTYITNDNKKGFKIA